MRILVVYDSIYGNTETIARAIGNALPGDVEVVKVSQVSARDIQATGLLIMGAPTHGSLPSQAAQALLAEIGPPAREDARAATFDTRLTWGFLRCYGYAADKIAEALQAKGWTIVGQEGGFFVRGLKKGPLKRGEVERAAAWARGLVGG